MTQLINPSIIKLLAGDFIWRLLPLNNWGASGGL